MDVKRRRPGLKPGAMNGFPFRTEVRAGLWLRSALVFLLLAGRALAQGIPAEVTLPLQDYLSLVETVERVERQRAEETARQEAPVAEVTAQRVALAVGPREAAVVSDFEVLLQGKILQPVRLPLAGFPERVEVRDEAGRTSRAAVGALEGGGVVFAATQPGRYTVHVEGRADLGTGTGRLSLGRVAAPVASTEIDLPADLAWASPGAVVVEERAQDGRRRVRLATARGADTVFEVRRKVDSDEAEKLIAQSVVLTILQLRPEGLLRHDVVLYEVRRGSLARLSVELPPGLEIEQAGTDEGTVVPVVETGRLTIHRQRRLQGVGYLVLSSKPPALPAEGLSLDSVRPETEVRSRYLAVSSAVAADLLPLPEASWSRVDLSDLPAALSEALAALDLTAAWRLAADEPGARLAVAPLPAAPRRDTTIRRRDTTTLLTLDGTLLFRDRFQVEARSRAGAALDVTLPAGGKLWSARVDGQAVRPLERGGVVSVPLGFSSRATAEVEVVSVQERALPPGRSQLALDLPLVTAPVLVHELRLLLPEKASYRVRRGDLRFTPAVAASSGNYDFDSFEESRTVQPEPPPPKQGAVQIINSNATEIYRKETEGLQQGLVGGVKPLPVTIPESGKALAFSGVLPPSRVNIELDVKAKGKS